MRAFFAAMATTAFQQPARCSSATVQRLKLSVLYLAALSTARAPMISRLRRYASPLLVIRTLDPHEEHLGPLHGFADRLRVGRIVLASLA